MQLYISELRRSEGWVETIGKIKKGEEGCIDKETARKVLRIDREEAQREMKKNRWCNENLKKQREGQAKIYRGRAKNEMRERGERGEGIERENVRRERGRELRERRERGGNWERGERGGGK